MKTKKIDPDIDSIGGLGSLTIEEEKALSEFFKKRKLPTKPVSKPKSSRRKKQSKTPA
jgi:hypothetical protein